MGRPLTKNGARIRDLILAYPHATWVEIAEIGNREGLKVARSTFDAAREALSSEGYTLPALPIGQPSQRRNRPRIEPALIPKLYPRPPKKPRCPTCGQLLKKASHGS